MTASGSHGKQTAWKDLEWGPWSGDVVLPHDPPDAELRESTNLPASLTVVRGDGVAQAPVFEPALQQYGKAMRAGEPRFDEPAVAARWFAARNEALDLALAAVAASPWAGHLVLRGSVLLKAWYGDAAREPGDLDFVVVPQNWSVLEPRTERMLDDIARIAGETQGAHVRIDAAGAERDEIWTYDRVPGRRLVLPWHVEGRPELPAGSVQLDFVFNEALPAEPTYTYVGDGAQVLAATPELSLAWKILWLLSDSYPQGKDLLDAVLLAESPDTHLSPELLLRTLASTDAHWAGRRVSPAWFDDLDIDVGEFHKEYPRHARSVDELKARLLTALRPTLEAGAATEPTDGYSWRARVLAPQIDVCRELARSEGPDAVQDWLLARNVPVAEGVVVTREALGADRLTLDDAADMYLGYRKRNANPYGYWDRAERERAKKLAVLGEQV